MRGYDAWKLATPEDDGDPPAEGEDDGPVMVRKAPEPVDTAEDDILF